MSKSESNISTMRFTQINDLSVLEQINILRSNILLKMQNDGFKSIVVTSPMAGDGKTTIASNLAFSFAAIGINVLLVHADLSSSTPANLLRSDADVNFGLSDYLRMTSDSDIDSLIHTTNESSLHILPNIKEVKDGSNLFSTARMRLLKDSLEQKFDLIIYDAPAMVPNADGIALAQVINNALLIFRLKHSTTERSDAMIKLLNLNKIRILGFVNNDVH